MPERGTSRPPPASPHAPSGDRAPATAGRRVRRHAQHSWAPEPSPCPPACRSAWAWYRWHSPGGRPCARNGPRRGSVRARSAWPTRTPGRRYSPCHPHHVRSAVPRWPRALYSSVCPFPVLHGWFCNSMEYQNGPPLPGHAPAGAHSAISNKISRRQVTVPKGDDRGRRPYARIPATLFTKPQPDRAKMGPSQSRQAQNKTNNRPDICNSKLESNLSRLAICDKLGMPAAW